MAVMLDKRYTQGDRETQLGPVGFIGAGKVGTALAALLNARGVAVTAVSGRTVADGRRMALAAHLERGSAADRTQTLARANIVFLTVPDDAIGPLCKEIADAGGWRAGQGVVHCSGALPSSVLQPAKDAGALVASFHPLQTFASLEAAIAHMEGSTFAIEGDGELVEQLAALAQLMGGTALQLLPEEKTLYHAAATIASNYTVTLAALAADLLAMEGVAPDRDTALRYLLPLIRGTVDNLDALGLPGALTGPLVRGDVGTVARHIEALQACAPETAHLYRHLARLTLPLARDKGKLDDETVAQLYEVIE
jgi:predicted short-subunit dehydrogenase-like oxidoreductase (DUF2520 family)